MNCSGKETGKTPVTASGNGIAALKPGEEKDAKRQGDLIRWDQAPLFLYGMRMNRDYGAGAIRVRPSKVQVAWTMISGLSVTRLRYSAPA